MALIQVNYMSEALLRMVTVNVILPVDKPTPPGMPDQGEKVFKTLYLLHGAYGNHMDWITETCIQRWAEEKDLAVVMPSGDNMFYVDQEKSHNYYGQFVGRELVEITRKMFPLSRKREDTYIAGLSMGGYGAIRNGLKYHETFSCIGGFSSAIFTDEMEERTNDVPVYIRTRDFAESVFGDLTKVKASDKNPRWLVEKLASEKAVFPKVFLVCGTEDALIGCSREARDYMEAAGVEVTYEEGPGDHEWDFWNLYIKKFLDWLPLD